MANEITASVSLSVSKSGASVSGSGSASADMANDEMVALVQQVTTSAASLTKGDISVIGWLYARNMDATNYVELGLDSGMTQVFAKLQPGKACLIPMALSNVYAKANTATCRVNVVMSEA